MGQDRPQAGLLIAPRGSFPDAPFTCYRGAAPGSSLEFNAHGERAGWAHDVDAGSIVVVARRAVAGFVEGVLEIGQLSTPI